MFFLHSFFRDLVRLGWLVKEKNVKRTFRSFYKNGKEWKEQNVLLKRTETTERSFEKNGNEQNVLSKRTDAQPWLLPITFVLLNMYYYVCFTL